MKTSMSRMKNYKFSHKEFMKLLDLKGELYYVTYDSNNVFIQVMVERQTQL